MTEDLCFSLSISLFKFIYILIPNPNKFHSNPNQFLFLFLLPSQMGYQEVAVWAWSKEENRSLNDEG
jgi:nicotinamide riboside transporter PnuC